MTDIILQELLVLHKVNYSFSKYDSTDKLHIYLLLDVKKYLEKDVLRESQVRMVVNEF